VRAYVGTGLRPWQWAAGVLFVILLWSWLGERGLDRRQRAPWVALALLLIPTYVDHARVLDRGDSMHYYSFLRSLLFDGDLQFANDYALLGWPEAAALPNVLPVGAPLLWSPLVVLVHVLRQAARVFGLGAPNGTEPVYQATVALATQLYGTAALFLLMDTLRRWVGPWAAFWATVMAWVGSPLRFYLSVLPGMAHGVEFLAAVLVLRAYLSLREQPDRRRAVLAGAACGLVFLTRSQDGLLLLVPLIELARVFARGVDRRRVILAGAAMALAFVVVALPQMAVWQAMFGAPVLIPHKAIHGDKFLHARPELLGALVSERGGLFASHPAMLLAVVGLVALAFRDARYVAAVVPVLLGAWYLNASVFDWYQVRRFTGVVPLLAPGLAVAIAPIARVGAIAALVALAFLRHDIAIDTLRAVPGDPAPVRQVVREMGDGLAADAYGVLEPLAPGAAIKMMAGYTGQGVVGRETVRFDLGRDASILRLPLRARSLSEPGVQDGVDCRWVRGDEARLFLPVADRVALVMTVSAAPADPAAPLSIEVAWMDTPIGGHAMTSGWSEYTFDVPATLVRPGTNVVTLSFRRPEGPRREVRRSAAIHSLMVEVR
jgi:hypothetical protein